MKPLMTDRDCELLNERLDKTKLYLEFGCGGSTYQAMMKPNIQHVYSVESDHLWISKLKSMPFFKTNRLKVSFLFIDIQTTANKLGYPGSKSKPADKAKYSRAITTLNPKLLKKIDTVLIDGRFRVACALHCFNSISNDAIVMFDDFVKRKHYHVVLDYYNIIQKGDNLVFLQKKSVDPPTPNVISKYEQIPL